MEGFRPCTRRVLPRRSAGSDDGRGEQTDRPCDDGRDRGGCGCRELSGVIWIHAVIPPKVGIHGRRYNGASHSRAVYFPHCHRTDRWIPTFGGMTAWIPTFGGMTAWIPTFGGIHAVIPPKVGIHAVIPPKVGIHAVIPPKVGIPAVIPPKVGIHAVIRPNVGEELAVCTGEILPLRDVGHEHPRSYNVRHARSRSLECELNGYECLNCLRIGVAFTDDLSVWTGGGTPSHVHVIANAHCT